MLENSVRYYQYLPEKVKITPKLFKTKDQIMSPQEKIMPYENITDSDLKENSDII
jgi:hypothetical protein